MRLPVLFDPPLGIASFAIGQSLGQAFYAMTTFAPGHRCAGPECTNNQSYVVVRQSESVVCHEPYGTIV